MKMLDLYNNEDHDSPQKNINLTPEQKIGLEVLHDTSRDGRVRDRIKAVLLRSEGWSTPMIAQALRLHETTILDMLMILSVKISYRLKMVALSLI